MMCVALLISILLQDRVGEASVEDPDYDVFGLKNTWDFSDFIQDRGRTREWIDDVAKPFLLKCAFSRGICLQSAACPGDRIIPDQSEWCTHQNKNHVCCHVARIRTPIDLFLAYD